MGSVEQEIGYWNRQKEVLSLRNEDLLDEIDQIERARHHDFMMRGDEEVCLAIMDRMGIKIDYGVDRDFVVDDLSCWHARSW